ncbi:cyclic 2,3-diphosphoglycerate synthase [Fibrobacterota bacterium]
MEKRKAIIMGAAGRDFHNFNVYFRENERYDVIAFTATQIPDIEGRMYPPELSGNLYPNGIPIKAESELKEIIEKEGIDEVFFAYSDVSHDYLMHTAEQVLAWGADFTLQGPASTMVRSTKPLISVCAVRTGCGKTQTSLRVVEILKKMGKNVASIRHPMPYGDLAKQKVQRFATLEDMKLHECTIEEMEEYEPHIIRGSIIYAGVDYEAILREAEKEADIIIWDGGNNDLPFYFSDLEIVVADPHRPGHELDYYPGEANLLRADVIVINKIDTAEQKNIDALKATIKENNPDAIVIEANSPVFVENSDQIKGKRVLAIEDGPTLTHGEMKYGAGVVAAKKYGAAELVDPRPFVSGTIAATFEEYPFIGPLLPAMGYGKKQMKDLEEVINRTDCDLVVVGTPIDLGKQLNIEKPHVRVSYDLDEIGSPNLEEILKKFQ